MIPRHWATIFFLPRSFFSHFVLTSTFPRNRKALVFFDRAAHLGGRDKPYAAAAESTFLEDFAFPRALLFFDASEIPTHKPNTKPHKPSATTCFLLTIFLLQKRVKRNSRIRTKRNLVNPGRRCNASESSNALRTTCALPASRSKMFVNQSGWRSLPPTAQSPSQRMYSTGKPPRRAKRSEETKGSKRSQKKLSPPGQTNHSVYGSGKPERKESLTLCFVEPQKELQQLTLSSNYGTNGGIQ